MSCVSGVYFTARHQRFEHVFAAHPILHGIDVLNQMAGYFYWNGRLREYGVFFLESVGGSPVELPCVVVALFQIL